jgi:hypothetical protein
MENTNTKWFAVSGIGFAIILLLFSMTQGFYGLRGNKNMDGILQVSMPRPVKDLILGFSLEGRNIVREIEAGIVSVTGLKNVDKKTAPNAAKIAADKAQKAKAAALAAARKRAQANEQRKKMFEARVVEQAERYRQSLIAEQIEATRVIQANQVEDIAPFKETKSTPPVTNTTSTDKMTSAEWKSLILTQPTKENIQKMITAFANGDIDLETYIEISETLIKDNSQDKRKMGAWALTSIYNRQAFTAAAHMVVDTDTTTQTTLNTYLYSYNSINTLAILDQILRGSDTVAATAAAQNITKAIQALQAQTSSGSSGGNSSGRNPGSATTVTQLSMSSFQRLIPTLKYLVQKNLNSLSQWAQSTLSQLQTATTTA